MRKSLSFFLALFALVSVSVFAEPAEGDRKSSGKKSPIVSVYNEKAETITLYEVKNLPAELMAKSNAALDESEREALVKDADVEAMIKNDGKKLTTISVAKSQRDRNQGTEACFINNWCWGGWYQPVCYSYYIPAYIGYCGVRYAFNWGYRRFGFYGCY